MRKPRPGASGRAAQAAWTAAVTDPTGESFENHTAPDLILEGSAYLRPIVGRPDVWTTLRASAGIFEHFTFVHSTADGRRSYLEWQATGLGQQLDGITVLVADETGRVAWVAIHLRPLPAALSFSVELRRRVIARMDPSFFYRSASGEH